MKAKLIITGLILLLLLVLSGCATDGTVSGGYGYSYGAPLYMGRGYLYGYPDYYRYYGYGYYPYSGYYYGPDYYPYFYPRRYYGTIPGRRKYRDRDDAVKRPSERHYLDRDGYHRNSGQNKGRAIKKGSPATGFNRRHSVNINNRPGTISRPETRGDRIRARRRDSGR